MMPTERLCELLDERGVEYVLDEEYGKKYPPEQRITWSSDIAGEDMTVTARDYCMGINDDGSNEYYLDLEFHEVFTPEQAIAATLGAGTCHNASKVMDEYGQARFACSECGAWIASHILWSPEYPNGESPLVSDCKLNFCPNCGRKVVGE